MSRKSLLDFLDCRQQLVAESRVKCLYVDDSEIYLLTLKALLERNGIDIETTNCCYRALTLCNKIKFDLILLDYHMPEINGIELARLIKSGSDSQSKDAVFVGISSLSSEEFATLDKHRVMDGFLPKSAVSA